MIRKASLKTLSFVSALLLGTSAWSVAVPEEDETISQASRPVVQSTPVVEDTKQEASALRVGQTLDEFPMFGPITCLTTDNGFFVQNHLVEATNIPLRLDTDPQNKGKIFFYSKNQQFYIRNDEGKISTVTRFANEGNGTLHNKLSGKLDPHKDWTQESQIQQNVDRLSSNVKNESKKFFRKMGF